MRGIDLLKKLCSQEITKGFVHRGLRFLGYELLFALLITQMVVPPHLALAGPDDEEDQISRTTGDGNGGEGGEPEQAAANDVRIDPLNTAPGTLDAQVESALVQSGEVITVEQALQALRTRGQVLNPTLHAIQEARDRARGFDPLRRFVDPYALLGQEVTVVEADGQKKTYDLQKENLDFPEGPSTYNLARDVKVAFDDKTLKLTIDSVDGSKLSKGRTYTQKFDLPGIQSVIKDRQHIHILYKNGDVETVFMAHSWLFKANLRAQGGGLIVPYIGGLPKKLVDTDKWTIDGELKLVFYDSIKCKDLDFAPAGVTQSTLRYGDVLVVDGNGKVQEVLTYGSIADAMSFHLNLLAKRNQLLYGDKSPVEVGLAGAQYGASLGAQTNERARDVTDRMLRGQSPETVLPQLQGVSQALGTSVADWGDNPMEERALSSARLQDQLSFLAAITELTSNPAQRSTFNHDEDATPHEVMQTLEGQVSAFLDDNFEEKKKGGWGAWIGRTLSMCKYFGLKAAWIGGTGLTYATVQAVRKGTGVVTELLSIPEAIWNGITYVLPSSFVFFEPLQKVKLFDLGFVEGPEVWYVAKFVGLCLLVAGVFIALPKYFFAKFDRRVLGRELPKEGFGQGSMAGLKVYYSIMMRLMSRGMQSVRAKVAGMLGFGDKLEAIKMGISGAAYKRHGGKEVGAIAIREKLEPVAILCQQITMQILLAELVEQGVVKQDDALDMAKIKTALGPEKFKHFTARAAILSGRVWDVLEGEIESDRGPPDEARLQAIEKKVWANKDLGSCVKDVTAGLSGDEKKELAKYDAVRRSRKRWLKFTGQNQLYYRFKNGEVPDNVVTEALGWNSFQDIISQVPMALVVPPFSDTADPAMLLAGDHNLTGVVSDRFVSETIANGASWASQTPHETIVWARKTAGSVVDGYRNPQGLDGSGRSAIRGQLRRAAPLDFNESSSRYAQGHLGLNFIYAIQKMGTRISVAEVKGLKILLTITTLIAMWGYMWDMPWDELGFAQFASFVDWFKAVGWAGLELWWKALVKVTAGAGLAYATYRILWMWHNLGLREVGNVNGDMEAFSTHINLAATNAVLLGNALAEDGVDDRGGIPAYEAECRRHVAALENFYRRHEKPVPGQEVDVDKLSGAALVNRVKEIVDAARKAPPAPMAENGLHKTAVTWITAGLTTIIGLTAFGYAWKWAETVKLGTWNMLWVPIIYLGLLGTGRALKVGAMQARARFGYVRRLRAMRRMLAQSPSFNNADSKERRYVYDQIMKAKALYVHYETDIPSSVLDMDKVHPQSANLMAVADAVYRYMIDNPPDDAKKFGNRVMAREGARHRDTLSDLPDVSGPGAGSGSGIRPWHRRCGDRIAEAWTSLTTRAYEAMAVRAAGKNPPN